MALAIILFVLIVIASLILAWRSMRSYLESPEAKHPYSLFLVRAEKALTIDLLNQVYQSLLEVKEQINPPIISFERVQKGEESVLIVFGPTVVLERYEQQLNLLEIEDYAKNFEPLYIFCWRVTRVGNKSDDQILSMEHSLYHSLALQPNEFFAFQLAAIPIGDQEARWQVTPRAVVYSPQAQRRAAIAKTFDSSLQNLFGWDRLEEKQGSQGVFNDFVRRAVTPQAVQPFTLTPEEIYKLLQTTSHQIRESSLPSSSSSV